MKRLLKFLRNLIFILAIILGIMLALTKVYEKKIISKAIELINQNINVPISVDEISLNIFRNFPYVTLQLHNIKVESPKILNRKSFKNIESYELLSLKNIYLSFNLKALINNTFELTEIVFAEGKIQLLVDVSGKTNYDFVFTKSASKHQDNLSVLLKSVKFNNIDFNLENAYKKSFVSFNSKNLNAIGKFYKQSYSVDSKGSIQLKKYVSNQISFVPNDRTFLEFNMGINNDTIHIQDGVFKTQGIKFITKGYIISGSNPYVDLSITGNNISIASLLNIFPEGNLSVKDFKSIGFLGVNTHIKGNVSEKISPRVKANFVINQGKIVHTKTNLSVNNIQLNGEYSNYSSPALSIPEFSFSTDSSDFKGSCELNSFSNPIFNLNSQFNINVNDVRKFLILENVVLLNGTIQGAIKANGKLPQEFTAANILNLVKNSHLKCNNFNLAFNNYPLKLSAYSGLFTLSNNQLNFKNVSGILNDTKTQALGSIDNFAGLFLYSYHPVSINGQFKLGNINYENIAYLFKSSSDSTTNENTTYIVNANLSINEFSYDKLNLSDITSNFIYKNHMVTLQNLNFKAFGGTIDSYIELKPLKGNSTVLYTKSTTKNVDISQVFFVFNNFDQKFITHNNLKGRVSSSFDGEIFLINGKPEITTLDFLGHLDIVDGGLMDFEPLQKLSAFSSIDELMHLKFDKLSNDILISNGIINIPNMNVANNAMNLSVFGQQELSGDYEYHIKILLSELLGNKSKKIRKKQSEFGIIQDDGLGKTTIYLLATGDKGITTVKFDRKELRKHLKNEISEEKRELKKILNKEFGWFKKDSIAEKKEPKQKHFEIEWDDE